MQKLVKDGYMSPAVLGRLRNTRQCIFPVLTGPASNTLFAKSSSSSKQKQIHVEQMTGEQVVMLNDPHCPENGQTHCLTNQQTSYSGGRQSVMLKR